MEGVNPPKCVVRAGERVLVVAVSAPVHVQVVIAGGQSHEHRAEHAPSHGSALWRVHARMRRLSEARARAMPEAWALSGSSETLLAPLRRRRSTSESVCRQEVGFGPLAGRLAQRTSRAGHAQKTLTRCAARCSSSPWRRAPTPSATSPVKWSAARTWTATTVPRLRTATGIPPFFRGAMYRGPLLRVRPNRGVRCNRARAVASVRCSSLPPPLPAIRRFVHHGPHNLHIFGVHLVHDE